MTQWAREDEKLHGLVQGNLQLAADQAIYWLQLSESIEKITPSTLKDAMGQYYMKREHIADIDNPIILSSIEKFASMNFDDIDIVYVYKNDIPDLALIRDPQINLDEIMVHSDIPIRPVLQDFDPSQIKSIYEK